MRWYRIYLCWELNMRLKGISTELSPWLQAAFTPRPGSVVVDFHDDRDKRPTRYLFAGDRAVDVALHIFRTGGLPDNFHVHVPNPMLFAGRLLEYGKASLEDS
jgi:hypothetical protein